MQHRLAHMLLERGERFSGDAELPLDADLNQTLSVLRMCSRTIECVLLL
jgi:hypothetical protein